MIQSETWINAKGWLINVISIHKHKGVVDQRNIHLQTYCDSFICDFISFVQHCRQRFVGFFFFSLSGMVCGWWKLAIGVIDWLFFYLPSNFSWRFHEIWLNEKGPGAMKISVKVECIGNIDFKDVHSCLFVAPQLLFDQF